MTTTELQNKPKLREAMGNLGFPCEILLASLNPGDQAEVERVLQGLNLKFCIFDNVEEYNEQLQPAFLPNLAELLTNEGVVLRRFRNKLEKGQLILVAHVGDAESARATAELLYGTGIDGAAYFAASKVSLLPPKSY